MELESVKKYLEDGSESLGVVDAMPSKLIEPLIVTSLRVDLIQPGRIVCSMKIPQRLLVRVSLSFILFVSNININ